MLSFALLFVGFSSDASIVSYSRFVEPPVLDMAAVVEDSSTRTPLIFVLSPGVVRLYLSQYTYCLSVYLFVCQWICLCTHVRASLSFYLL